MVVDDADLNVTLLADLVRTVSYWPPGTPPVRLLLLARHTTGWWDTLNQRTGQLASELADPTLELHDGELAPAVRAEHHTRALTAFAAHLPDPVTPAGPVGLADPAFANPLLVHMHALLTVCGAQVPTTGDAIRERILDAVLGRERDRWADTFPAGVPTGGARTRRQAVTVATLLAPPTEIAAAHAMRIIDEFASDAAAGARAAVATWLRGLYPGSDPPWVAPLRPDLLAEQLLASCEQLSELVLAGYASITVPEQTEQILAELTRAGTRHPVRGALDRLLANHLPDLLTAAMRAPAGRLPDLLDHALRLAPQPGLAAELAVKMPRHSIQLAELATTLISQQTDHYRKLAGTRPDEFSPRLARSLNNLSKRLADLGRREEALTEAEKSTRIRRELAKTRPDKFSPDLASSLNNLAYRLADQGRPEEALAAAEEATSIRRELAKARPDEFSPRLAGSLNNLAYRLADQGRPEEALAAAEEATRIRRELAKARPDEFRRDLASSLNSLAYQLGALGQREEALAAAEEATRIRRELAKTLPDEFGPDLAGSLHNLAYRLGLGRRDEALSAAEEAVTIRQEMADRRPDAHRDKLERSQRLIAQLTVSGGNTLLHL